MLETYCVECGRMELLNESAMKGDSVRLKCQNCKTYTLHKQGKDNLQEKESPSPASASSHKNKLKWFNSLQVRFAGVLVLLTTLILGSFITFEYVTTKKESLKELSLLAEIAATRMSQYLVEPVWGIEEGQLSESIISEMMDKQIQCILIIDGDTNNLLIGKSRDKNGEIRSFEGRQPADSIIQKRPIVRKGNVIGEIQVVVTPKYAMQNLKKSIVTLIVTMAILYCAILVTVFFILRNLIIKPIEQVTSATDRISLGELDITIDHRSKNEIGFLVDSINRMQTSLNIAFKLIKQRREEA